MQRGLRLKVKTSPLQSSMVALATRTNHCSRLTVAVEVAELQYTELDLLVAQASLLFAGLKIKLNSV